MVAPQPPPSRRQKRACEKSTAKMAGGLGKGTSSAKVYKCRQLYRQECASSAGVGQVVVLCFVRVLGDM